MRAMYTGKINCSKIVKDKLFSGQTGQMMDCVIFIDTDKPDKYGNTMSIQQSTKKDEASIYLGNFKEYKPKSEQKNPESKPDNSNQPDDLPF